MDTRRLSNRIPGPVLPALLVMCCLFPAPATAIVVDGFSAWTDRAGTNHVSRNVRIEAFDADTASTADLLGSGQTNNSGNLVLTGLPGIDADEGGPVDVFVRASARSNAAFVSPDGTLANTHHIDSDILLNAIGPTVFRNAIAPNTTTAGQAFSVHQALQFHHDYAVASLGATVPANGVAVTFASTETSALTTTMDVLASDWADWDVIHHEYGHILANNNNLDDSDIGGDHNFGVDNINGGGTVPARGKDNGTKIAWQEGLATYLALSAQDAGNLRTVVPGLPAELGDEFYDDREAGGNLRVSIETEGNPTSVGEGDEASVMRILWDIYDTDTESYSDDDEYSDTWKLGDKKVFDLMKGNGTLHDFWIDVANDQTKNDFERRSELGEVFEEYNVSSVLTDPMDDIALLSDRILFDWDEQNSNHSDKFEVLVLDDAFDEILFRSGELSTTTWLSNQIPEGDYNWVVLNNSILDTALDDLESYWSGAYQFSTLGKDFGDAPISYGTLLADDGPRYAESQNQRIGNRWDVEFDGQPTARANGDDANLFGLGGADDEDGIVFSLDGIDVALTIEREGVNSYFFDSWWDLDFNGIFDHTSERFIHEILDLGPGQHPFFFALPFDPRQYYSRFRLTWIDDPLALAGGVSLFTDITPTGEFLSADGFSHGEVQDYAPLPEAASLLLVLMGALPLLGSGARRRVRPAA